MKFKSFNDYDEACEFRDKVDGQIQWNSYRDGTKDWTVWYSDKNELTFERKGEISNE